MGRKSKSGTTLKQWVDENTGKHICKCGCGNAIHIKYFHSHKGIPKFINGHILKMYSPKSGEYGENARAYKNGKTLGEDGYMRSLVVGARKNGKRVYRKEHRAIVEAHIGRKLLEDEVVHHINGNKADNRLENLQVMSRGEHARMHRNEYIAKSKASNDSYRQEGEASVSAS